MKNPLRFQITEFDCGTTSLNNVFVYLFERENIPIEIIKFIYLYSLDCYDENGKLGQGGTSREAIILITKIIIDYATKHNIKIDCKYFLKEEVTEQIVRDCINKKGCVLVRTYLKIDHYVLITDIDYDFVYLWDPYYLNKSYFDSDKDVEMIFDKPFNYNRKVSIARLNSLDNKDFAFGPIDKRECVAFYSIK